MLTVHTVSELRARVASWRREGLRIGFVPTMGNLHQGHLELVEKARALSDRGIASVFVNPLQFGPNEDFDRYPRTLPEDQLKLEGAQCDLLFAPSVSEMYPRGRESLSGVRVPALADTLEGAFRPGFFDGVATVVNILFNQVQPDLAVFGEKDYQQLQVIRRMTADLHLPIAIVGHPTVREPDGLAMSSRNQYLSAEERIRAGAIYRVLSKTACALRAGRRDFAALEKRAMQVLETEGFAPQYFEIRTSELDAPTEGTNDCVILAAATLGRTRLIDNFRVDLSI